MTFAVRQIEEINPLSEISVANMTPGAVGNGTTVFVSQAFTLGSPGSAFPATGALGDQIELYPSAAAATNGLNITAYPTATPGTYAVYFTNNTGGSITPVAGAKYIAVATRFPNTAIF
jgi:hypothetical protein